MTVVFCDKKYMSSFFKCVISLRTMVWNYGYECFNTPKTKDREYLYVAFDGQLKLPEQKPFFKSKLLLAHPFVAT